MIRRQGSRRYATLALLAAIALALAGCLLAPGKFVSTLDIRKDGQFTFTYVGEIHMLAMSRLANMGSESSMEEVFTAKSCQRDPAEERPCTPAQLAEQKSDWEAKRRSSSERNQRNSESMKAMLGGLDPSDPRAAEEFASRLRRQAGWRRVVYKGDGVYDVDFALSGRLDHDFSFPTIERFAMANPFVQLALRQDGTVRIDAPGFGPAQGGEPLRSMMQAGAMGSGASEPESVTSSASKTDGGLVEIGRRGGAKSTTPPLPIMDGKFTIRTDGAILANNTDEGPLPDPAGQRLDWTVTMRSPAAPTALVKLTR